MEIYWQQLYRLSCNLVKLLMVPQMNQADFGDRLTVTLAPPAGQQFWFGDNYCDYIVLITLTFGSDIHGPLR